MFLRPNVRGSGTAINRPMFLLKHNISSISKPPPTSAVFCVVPASPQVLTAKLPPSLSSKDRTFVEKRGRSTTDSLQHTHSISRKRRAGEGRRVTQDQRKKEWKRKGREMRHCGALVRMGKLSRTVQHSGKQEQADSCRSFLEQQHKLASLICSNVHPGEDSLKPGSALCCWCGGRALMCPINSFIAKTKALQFILKRSVQNEGNKSSECLLPLFFNKNKKKYLHLETLQHHFSMRVCVNSVTPLNVNRSWIPPSFSHC